MTLVPHDKGAEATVSRVTRPAHGSNPRRAARELRAALLVENRHGR